MTNPAGNLIVFDWNGTILADTSACLNATNIALNLLGKPKVTRAHYQKHYTMPLADFYHALGVEPETVTDRKDEINALWHATYNATPIRLRRGAKAMLQAMKLAGCQAIILSNYVTHLIEAQAQKLGVRQHFGEIIAFTATDATFRKVGKGARLKEYLAANPFTNGIIIGDSPEEVEIGRDTGMTTVAITDGMCSATRLRAAKPDYVIGSLEQLPAIIHRTFKVAA